jgi:hypothetical protein
VYGGISGPCLTGYCFCDRPSAIDDVIQTTFAGIVLTNRIRSNKSSSTLNCEFVMRPSELIDAEVRTTWNTRVVATYPIDIARSKFFLNLVF